MGLDYITERAQVWGMAALCNTTCTP